MASAIANGETTLTRWLYYLPDRYAYFRGDVLIDAVGKLPLDSDLARPGLQVLHRVNELGKVESCRYQATKMAGISGKKEEKGPYRSTAM